MSFNYANNSDCSEIKGYHIGVIDSGLGGLSVLKEIIEKYPYNNYSYFGDSKNAPYGDRDPQEMKVLAKKLIYRAISENIDILLIACNTISVYIKDLVDDDIKIPVIGTIDSGAEAALDLFDSINGQYAIDDYKADIGLMATRVTVNSHAYKKAINELRPGIKVMELACPDLVPAIEKDSSSAEIICALKKDLISNKPFAPVVILGCTHFPLIEKEIQNYLGQNIKLANPAIKMTEKMASSLFKQKQYVVNDTKCFKRRLFSSGNLSIMKEMSKKIIHEDHGKFKYIFNKF